MELHDMAEHVDSKQSFLEFVAALRADLEASGAADRSGPSPFYSPQTGGWENSDLWNFLEAMQAWAEDMGDRVAEQPTWRTFAEMLLAAKTYE